MSTPSAAASPEHDHREQWSGQLGFLMAAIGSAIGLGNIWRFPGVAYESGGGAFLIPYLCALLTAGIPILLLDYALGHRYRGSAPAVFRRLHPKAEALGWLQVAIAFVIIVYYAVVIAWAASYVFFSVDHAWGDDPGTFLTSDFLKVAEPGSWFDFVPGVLWPLVGVWVVVLVIMALGIQNGLEKANKVFLPLLVVLFAALVVRALLLDGAMDGLNAFFTPRWDALGNPQVWIAAYSQIFFSLSVAFGIMLTYASYLPRRVNLPGTGLVAAFANSSFEILAGIGVFATLGFMAASQGVAVADLKGLTGVGLSFVTFPTVISKMPGGELFGVLFFTSLVLAGLTSQISLVQVVSAAFQEKFNLTRLQATLCLGGFAALLSVVFFGTTTGLILLDTVDQYINNIGIVSSAIVMTLLTAYGLRKLPDLQRHLNQGSSIRVGAWWRVLVAVVLPVALAVMLVSKVVALIRDGYGGYPAWFTGIFGWALVLGCVGAAFLYAAIPWRTRVDEGIVHGEADNRLHHGAHPATPEDHHHHRRDES